MGRPNLRLALAAAWLPGRVKRHYLDELLRRTAVAFGVPAPEPAGRGYRAALQGFAAFSAAEANARAAAACAGQAEAAAVRARLRATAFELGCGLRRRLALCTRAQALRAARLMYGVLGIDFEGHTDGQIVIRACGFSRAYTPAACALVSGLDEGLLAGLSGSADGRLEFAARITEGCTHCRATFHFEGAEP